MKDTENHLGQPIGFALPGWTPPPRPDGSTLQGRFGRLERLDTRHAVDLFAANAHDVEGRNWTYMPYGPFADLGSYKAWVEEARGTDDPLFYALVDGNTGKAAGVASYLRITEAAGVIEVGHINYSPLLQKTAFATEAMVLMMAHAFELGYRRYEWKCDALNAPSRNAAVRLGFTYEGIFRNATLYKERNRDTAWFSITDYEWPALKSAFDQWLDPSNFDADGGQKTSLSSLTQQALAGPV